VAQFLDSLSSSCLCITVIKYYTIAKMEGKSCGLQRVESGEVLLHELASVVLDKEIDEMEILIITHNQKTRVTQRKKCVPHTEHIRLITIFCEFSSMYGKPSETW